MSDRNSRRRAAHARRGFTILELLAVIAIIAILGTIVTINLVGAQDKTRITQTKSNMATIKGALNLYRGTYGVYPAQLQLLVAENTMTKIPLDAWNREYKYFAPASFQGRNVEFLLISAGRNIEDPSDDIVEFPEQQ